MDWNTSQDFSTWQNQALLFETRKDISQKSMGWKKEGSSSLSSRSDPKAQFAGEKQEEPYKQCMLESTVLLSSSISSGYKGESSEIKEQAKIC